MKALLGPPPHPSSDGTVVLAHWARRAHAVLDPAMCGTGPVRGEERRRRGFRDMVPFVCYGVDAVPDASARPPVDDPCIAGYVREKCLGSVRHLVLAKAADLYDWYGDPDGLRRGIDPALAGADAMTRYERLVRDAGWSGIHYRRGYNGRIAVLFHAAVPFRIVHDSVRGSACRPAGNAVLRGTEEAVHA